MADRICPYCNHHFDDIDAEVSPDEDSREEECPSCCRKFWAYETILGVSLHSTPDCALNGEEHAFEYFLGNEYGRCTKCGRWGNVT